MFFERSSTCMLILDRRFRIVRINPAWAQYLAADPEDLPGRHYASLFPDGDPCVAPTLAALETVRSSNVPLSLTNHPFTCPHQSHRAPALWDGVIQPLRGPRGGLTHLMIMADDVARRGEFDSIPSEKTRHAHSLLRLSRRFESAQSYSEILEAARDEVRATIGYTNLWAYLLTDDLKHARPLVGGGPVTSDNRLKAEVGLLTIEGDPMLEEIAHSRKPVIVEDARTDPRTDKKIVAYLGNRTIINVPIIFSERILGTIGTGTFGDEGPRLPTPAELEFLEALASHMAVSLDRIRLLELHLQTEETLRRLNRELHAVSNCNQTVLRATDEQSLLDEICRIIHEEAGYRLAWVGFAEDDSGLTIRPVSWAGVERSFVDNARKSWSAESDRGHGLAGTAIRTGCAVYAQDIATDERMSPWRESALAHGFQSGIALPLKNSAGKPFGALMIYSTEANAITPEEGRLLDELAGDLAFGIMVLRNRKALEGAEQEGIAHLWFLQSLDQLNRAIQGAKNLDQMIGAVLDVLLSVFNCDRTWMVFPCDPDALTWQITMERARPEYPGTLPSGTDLPMDPGGAEVYRILRNTDGPVQFGPGFQYPVPEPLVQSSSIRSFIAMALYPHIGQPWSLCLHQCAQPRRWTHDEERLLQELGRRLTDGLTTLLAHRAVQESEERFRLIAENTVDTIAVLDLNLKTLYISPSILKLRGCTADEALHQSLEEIITPDSLRVVYETLAAERALEASGQGEPSRTALLELEEYRKGGETIWVELSASFLRDAAGNPMSILTVTRDITRRKRSEEALRRSLTEKEVLLKEIHHRVKNNLQIISSLLNLQATELTDEPARSALVESQARIKSMALVHETFYRATDFSHVDLLTYSDRLAVQVLHTWMKPGINVISRGEPVLVGIDTAVPCGLVLNELVTNALKHAFNDSVEGLVIVTVQRRDPATVEMIVQDNGSGFPEGIEPKEVSSMGMTLVVGLVEQLSGTLEVQRNDGTKFIITFPG
jgi:PAS domain S-box-containing protein